MQKNSPVLTNEEINQARWMGVYSAVVTILFVVLGWHQLEAAGAFKYLALILWLIALLPLVKTWIFFSITKPKAFWSIQKVFG